MSSEELTYLLEVDDATLTKEQNEELIKLKATLSNRIPILNDINNYIATSRNVIYFMKACALFKELYQKRGCLLTPEQRQEEYDLLSQFTRENYGWIASNIGLNNYFCSVLALSYRMIFELVSKNAPPFDIAFELLQTGGNAQCTVALTALKEFVNSLKESSNKLTENQHRTVRSDFFHTQLREYFVSTFAFIQQTDHPCLSKALDLMLECLKYPSPPSNEDVLEYKFQVPPDWMDFYTNNDFPEKMFMIYQHATLENKNTALQILLYFVSATDATWRVVQQQLEFIKTIAGGVISALEQQIDGSLDLNMSRLIYKIGLVLPLQYYVSSDLAAPFFMSVKSYSDNLFQKSIFQECCNCLLKFWGKNAAVCSSNAVEIPSELNDIFREVFMSYVDILLDSISNIFEGSNEEIPSNSELTLVYESLWHVAAPNIAECTEFLLSCCGNSLEMLKTHNERLPDAILRVAVCIIIISARFLGRPNRYRVMQPPDIVQQKAALIDCVLDVIVETTEIIPAIADEVQPQAIFLEKALLSFVGIYKRDMFANKPEVNEIYEQMRHNDRKAVFDCFVNRFISDLKIFNGSGDLLRSLLTFIDDISQSFSKDLASKNEFIQALVTRQDQIQFPLGATTDLAKVHRLLNAIYARNIMNQEGFSHFLPALDQEFAALRSASPEAVIQVFSEVRGVLKGVTSVVLYYTIVQWLLDSHAEHFVSAIQLNAGKVAVETVLQSWQFLASNKGRKFVPANGSVDGIRVFRVSLDIARAALEIEDADVYARIVQLCSASVCAQYANFGVMEYFEDPSFSQMVETLFSAVTRLDTEEIFQRTKVNTAMLGAFASILEIQPEAILGDDDRRRFVLNVAKVILIRDEGESPAGGSDIQKEVGRIITKMMQAIIQTESDFWEDLQPAFVTLLNIYINTPGSVVSWMATPLYLFIIHSSDFASSVFTEIINSFDDGSVVNELFTELMNKASETQPQFDAPNSFKFQLATVKNEMARFPTLLSDIEALAQFFEL